MADPATRVALLARPGTACDRLQVALREAGADIVLVADPTQIQADGVRTAGAQAVLIALEPSVEEALDRFDMVIGDPAITVIFDEAELAAQRDGWDAARWVRHLSAKLNRHGNVLPPGAEADEVPSDQAMEFEPGTLHRYERPESDLGMDALVLEFETLAAATPGEHAWSTPDAPALNDAPSLSTPVPDAAQSDTIQPDAMQSMQLDPLPSDDAGGSEHIANERFHRDLSALHERIATMELVDAPRTIARVGGAVLVLAGIGGPDAVRQLLGGLPATFPQPVLVQQRLDGARHDKLVRQMQRATSMPVQLAADGEALQPGHVYILPAELGLVAQDNGLRFHEGGDLFASLPAGESAVILLSGSDPASVDAAMGLSWGGALVAGQTPDGCYDATAPEALIARGAEAGTPADIAKRLAARWPA